MRILIDTNVLIRAVQRSHPACRIAIAALKHLRQEPDTLCLAPQNIIEFWSVCTRPIDVNGIGLSVAVTDRYVQRLERMFTILPESPQTFREWRGLVVQHAVSGAKVHDARLVAVMKAHAITRILTFNVDDFSRYHGIEIVHPDTVQEVRPENEPRR